MSTSSSAVQEFEQQQRTSAVLVPTQPLYWSIVREIWEFRSMYIAPALAAAVFLIGFTITVVHLPGSLREAMAGDPMKLHEVIQQPYNFAGLLLMGVTFLFSFYYCLEALHGERRDRSILFWKSLPVSDLTVVIAKAAVPILILPLITVLVAVVLECFMALSAGAAVSASGLGVANYWPHVGLVHLWLMLLFHMVAIHGFWFAPFYGWMLMVSAWARRAPFLWATVPFLAVGILEKLMFNTTHFVALLNSRFFGAPENSGWPPDHLHAFTLVSVAKFVVNPGLWIGLALTAAFLYAAARLRRARGPV